MMIEERHRAIVDTVETRGSITVAEIQRRFNVSYASAKRDLAILEEKKLIKRTHGGAVALDYKPRRSIASLPCESSVERAVAEYAAALICEGETIFIPHGSLGISLARSIPESKNVRIVVNSTELLSELRPRPAVKVIMLGGEMDSDGCFCDSFALGMLKRMRLDRAFVSTDGISADFGLSAKNAAQAELFRTVLVVSRRKLGLYPTERLGIDSSVSICGVGELDCIVTDKKPDSGFCELCMGENVKLCVCSEPERDEQ